MPKQLELHVAIILVAFFLFSLAIPAYLVKRGEYSTASWMFGIVITIFVGVILLASGVINSLSIPFLPDTKLVRESAQDAMAEIEKLRSDAEAANEQFQADLEQYSDAVKARLDDHDVQLNQVSYTAQQQALRLEQVLEIQSREPSQSENEDGTPRFTGFPDSYTYDYRTTPPRHQEVMLALTKRVTENAGSEVRNAAEQMRDSIEEYRYMSAIKRFDEHTSAHYEVELLALSSIARYLKGDKLGALKHANDAIHIAPHLSDPYVLRAIVAENDGPTVALGFPSSYSDIDEALARDEANALAWFLKAQVLGRAWTDTLAMEYLSKAMEAEPTFEPAFEQYAAIRAFSPSFIAPYDGVIERFLSKFPKNTSLLRMKIERDIYRARPSECIASSRALVLEESSDDSAHLLHSIVLSMSNDPIGAWKAIDKIKFSKHRDNPTLFALLQNNYIIVLLQNEAKVLPQHLYLLSTPTANEQDKRSQILGYNLEIYRELSVPLPTEEFEAAKSQQVELRMWVPAVYTREVDGYVSITFNKFTLASYLRSIA